MRCDATFSHSLDEPIYSPMKIVQKGVNLIITLPMQKLDFFRG